MKFEFEIQGSRFAVQEPVPIIFRFTVGEVGVDLPVEYSAVDVITLALRSKAGAVVARASGYTKFERMGFPPFRVHQNKMQTAPMEAGQVAEWSDDLLAYFDMNEAGTYEVQVRFTFTPGSIALEAAPVTFQILSSRCVVLDVLQDAVSMPMLYFLQQHRTAVGTSTFVRATTTASPLGFWEGTCLPIPPGVVPRVSEADFTAAESFVHDTFRWVAWVEGDSLRLTSFSESTSQGTVHDVPLGIEQTALCGRPIQHADKSVSALLTGQVQPGEVGIYQVDIREDGQELGRFQLFEVMPGCWPGACAPDILGSLHVVATTGLDRLPLHLLVRSAAGRITQGVLLPSDFFSEAAPEETRAHAARILAIRLGVKPSPGPNAVLVVALLDREETRRGQGDMLQLIQIFLEELTIETTPVQVRTITLSRGLLQANETVISADIARAQGKHVHALFTTSMGRVFHVPPRGGPTVVAVVPAGQTALSTLVVTANQEVYGFFPTEENGVASTQLARARP